MGIKSESLEILKQYWDGCIWCNLHYTRKNIVWWKGNPDSKILIIGEAPGATEDELGIPFVGIAGKKLDSVFKIATGKDLLENSLVTNVVSCRPPSNRVPQLEEIKSCKDKLYYIIKIIEPKIVLLLGSTASRIIAGVKPITTWRGRLLDSYIMNSKRDIVEFKAIPTYHPSYIIRTGNNPKFLKEMIVDIKKAWKESNDEK